jgi:mannose-6-phosphate isomerase-like protein (cupin superfamily)
MERRKKASQEYMKAAGTWQTRQAVPRAARRPKRKRGRTGAGSGEEVSVPAAGRGKELVEAERERRGKVWRVLMGCSCCGVGVAATRDGGAS